MRTPDYIIKIAADSVEKLRRSDIERVLENCSDEELRATAAWIKCARPDLAAKIDEELDYQNGERRIFGANNTTHTGADGYLPALS